MAPLFANQSCDPFQSRVSPCTLGNYAQYAVDVKVPQDIISTLEFAEMHNIRLVIRNTGHDYNGRSTGAGSIAIWTHHLKDMEVLDWNDEQHSSKALKVGAGVLGYEAVQTASRAGLVVVTGECPSVGLTGGYIQGGGHSALSTSYGLAADNALSYDVVTPQGYLVSASKSQHSDLFWALSGGGGGNYGVVVSVTVKAHPDAVVSGAKFQITPLKQSMNDDNFYKAVTTLHDFLPQFVDSGLMVIYFVGPDLLQSPVITAYNKTATELKHILSPFFEAVSLIGMTVEMDVTESSTYFDHFSSYLGPFPAGNIQVGTTLFGGRLIPRSVLPYFTPTLQKVVEMGATFIGVGLNVSRFGGNGSNAVLPQWRNSIVQASPTLPWSFEKPFEDMVAEQNRITTQLQPVIEAATPGAGAYMNEADFQQPDFQQTFFGTNYPRLLSIKRKYDPKSLLYAVAGVGSEHWHVALDGRMCMAKTEVVASSDGMLQQYFVKPLGYLKDFGVKRLHR